MRAEPEIGNDIPRATWLFKFSLVVAGMGGVGLVIPLHRATMPRATAAQDGGPAIDEGQLVTISVLERPQAPTPREPTAPGTSSVWTDPYAPAQEIDPFETIPVQSTPVASADPFGDYAPVEVAQLEPTAQPEESTDAVPNPPLANSPSDDVAAVAPRSAFDMPAPATPIESSEPATLTPMESDASLTQEPAPVVEVYQQPMYVGPTHPMPAYPNPMYQPPVDTSMVAPGAGVLAPERQACCCPDCCGPRHPILWKIFHPRTWGEGM